MKNFYCKLQNCRVICGSTSKCSAVPDTENGAASCVYGAKVVTTETDHYPPVPSPVCSSLVASLACGYPLCYCRVTLPDHEFQFFALLIVPNGNS